MPYFYHFDISNKYAAVSASGKITFIEMMNNTNEMIREKGWNHNIQILLDYSMVEDIVLHGKDIRYFFKRLKKMKSKLKDSKIAIVSPNASTFCLVRLWECLSEKGLILNSCVFNDQKEAKAWLES